MKNGGNNPLSFWAATRGWDYWYLAVNKEIHFESKKCAACINLKYFLSDGLLLGKSEEYNFLETGK